MKITSVHVGLLVIKDDVTEKIAHQLINHVLELEKTPISEEKSVGVFYSYQNQLPEEDFS